MHSLIPSSHFRQVLTCMVVEQVKGMQKQDMVLILKKLRGPLEEEGLVSVNDSDIGTKCWGAQGND